MSRKLVYAALILLTILHQDFWLWDSKTLVLGFLPSGLAYHAAYTAVAALVWYLALQYAWPEDAVRFARDAEEADK